MSKLQQNAHCAFKTPPQKKKKKKKERKKESSDLLFLNKNLAPEKKNQIQYCVLDQKQVNE